MAIVYGANYGRPTLDLNFAKNKSLIDTVSGLNLVTFTRSQTAREATYVGADGLIKTAVANEPRFDHNPLTGECLGLLVEESRTNLLTRSEEFNDAAWNKNLATVTANAATAPDGTITADQVNSISSQTSYLRPSVSISSSTTYTFSLYVKPLTTNKIIVMENFGIGNLTINLSTLTTSGGGGTAQILTLSNGWYRIIYTFTGTTQFPAIFLAGYPTSADSASFYFWGAQLEVGSFPTSYIPTSGSTVTRSADSASITGTNFSRWYRQDEVSCFISGRLSAAGDYLFSFSDGTVTNRILSDPAGYALYVFAGGVESAQISSTVPANTDFKFAISAKQNSFNISNNGILGTLDTSGAMPTGINKLNLFTTGSNTEGSSGTISRLTYYPSRLQDFQLQQLTK